MFVLPYIQKYKNMEVINNHKHKNVDIILQLQRLGM